MTIASQLNIGLMNITDIFTDMSDADNNASHTSQPPSHYGRYEPRKTHPPRTVYR
jgi:hypothetical protein